MSGLKIVKSDNEKLILELSEDSFEELSQDELDKLNKSNKWIK